MKKQVLSILLAAMMVCSFFASCSTTKTDNSKVSSGSTDSSITDDTDVDNQSDVTDSTSSASGTNESTSKNGNTATTASGKSTTKKTKGVAVLPDIKGDHIDASAMVLPNLNITNKTVKVLCHGGEFENLDNFYKKYGIKIEYDRVVNTEKTAKLQKRIAAGDSPDVFCCIFYPSLVTRNYVQNLDKYFDYNSKVWSGIKNMLDNYMWGGKHYYMDIRYAVDGCVWYNKDIFDEYGLTDPWTLYKQNKWNWNTYKSYAKQLTVDANKDGTPEQWGVDMGAMELVNNSTGKGFITYVKNGTPANNLKSAEIARAINFCMDLRKNGYIYLNGSGSEAFAAGKVGMSWGYIWQREPYKDLIESDSLGLAPSPRDPSADKYYMYTSSEGYYIPRGAKNPTGAVALLTALRINSFNDTLIRTSKTNLIKKGIWTNEFQTVYDKMQSCENLVIDPWATFNLGDYFGDFYTRAATESWSKIAAEISPKVDATITKMYSTNK